MLISVVFRLLLFSFFPLQVLPLMLRKLSRALAEAEICSPYPCLDSDIEAQGLAEATAHPRVDTEAKSGDDLLPAIDGMYSALALQPWRQPWGDHGHSAGRSRGGGTGHRDGLGDNVGSGVGDGVDVLRLALLQKVLVTYAEDDANIEAMELRFGILEGMIDDMSRSSSISPASTSGYQAGGAAAVNPRQDLLKMVFHAPRFVATMSRREERREGGAGGVRPGMAGRGGVGSGGRGEGSPPREGLYALCDAIVVVGTSLIDECKVEGAGSGGGTGGAEGVEGKAPVGCGEGSNALLTARVNRWIDVTLLSSESLVAVMELHPNQIKMVGDECGLLYKTLRPLFDLAVGALQTSQQAQQQAHQQAQQAREAATAEQRGEDEDEVKDASSASASSYSLSVARSVPYRGLLWMCACWCHLLGENHAKQLKLV